MAAADADGSGPVTPVTTSDKQTSDTTSDTSDTRWLVSKLVSEARY